MSVKIRNLEVVDIYFVSKILNKINLELHIGEHEELGLNFMINAFKSILENLHLAQKEVNEFFAKLLEMDVEEFEKQDPVVFFEVIEQLSKYDSVRSYFRSFFTKAKK